MWFQVNPTRQITPRTIQVGRTQEFTAPVSKVPPAPFWNKQAIWMIYSHWVVGTFDWVVGTFDCVVGIVNNLLNRNLPFLNVFGYSYCFSASAPFCSFAYTTPACIPINNVSRHPVCRVVTGLHQGWFHRLSCGHSDAIHIFLCSGKGNKLTVVRGGALLFFHYADTNGLHELYITTSCPTAWSLFLLQVIEMLIPGQNFFRKNW
jgi:hypothetical protein